MNYFKLYFITFYSRLETVWVCVLNFVIVLSVDFLLLWCCRQKSSITTTGIYCQFHIHEWCLNISPLLLQLLRKSSRSSKWVHSWPIKYFLPPVSFQSFPEIHSKADRLRQAVQSHEAMQECETDGILFETDDKSLSLSSSEPLVSHEDESSESLQLVDFMWWGSQKRKSRPPVKFDAVQNT